MSKSTLDPCIRAFDLSVVASEQQMTPVDPLPLLKSRFFHTTRHLGIVSKGQCNHVKKSFEKAV